MSYGPRVYVGRLSHRARESDVERFFRGFGKIRDIMLKNGFGFVEFDDLRDAEDAIHDLNGRDLCGERVLLEIAKGTPRGAGGAFVSDYVPPMSGRGSRSHYSNSKGDARSYGRQSERGYRLVIENLSTRVSWQDLKDMMRPYGEVMFADAHHYRKNEGVVEFSSKSDVKRAVDKLEGKEINGRKIHLVPDFPKSRSRSRSPSADYRDSRSRSRSADYSPHKKAKRSRSRSGSDDRNGRSHSRSTSPPKKRASLSADTRARSPTPRSRSASPS
uniref:Serine/arginine-rich splicing factor 5 n=1 Tax=Phallusia mammillata TaxID=59560 RepID=A0A6F9DUA3_9ASCI|nr:serine/arginine-rich splicing factor 5 [Phallusia mammillata]